jgi:hypothetical protein
VTYRFAPASRHGYQGAPMPKKMNKLGTPVRGTLLRLDPLGEADA